MTLVISGMILLLGASPALATVAGDVAAGLPMDKVIDNGLKAGLALDTIIVQALDSGVEPCPVIKAALGRGLDLTKIFMLLTDYCRTSVAGPRKDDPKWCEACSTCSLMKCANELGRDPVEIANAMMAIGSDLDEVRNCLSKLGFPDAANYAYSPPGPPGYSGGVGPTFPGGGGGGGVASPSM